jgi:nicotinamide-nucleotide amidase
VRFEKHFRISTSSHFQIIKKMTAEIITIGDEILIGQIVDTNSAWIAARLNEAGIVVARKLSIADSHSEIMRTFAEASSRADIVIVTGGLGPTKDDITKVALAEYFGCGMKRDQATYVRNEQRLKERGVGYNALNQGQAMVPECCTVIANHNGTAPGMWFERAGKVLISLPGVPFEMEILMRDEVLPRLKEHFSLKKIIHKNIITFGIAESILAETISDWEDALPEWMHLAYLPNPSQMRLRLSAYDVEGVDEEAEIDRQIAELERIIPEYIIGYGDDTLVSALARLLKERKATLAVAESCTGGALSAAFTAQAGASEYFLGSVTSYSNDVKTGVLGVRAEDIAQHGAVSREVAEQMAAGVRKLLGSDYSIATTGVAGPDGGSPEKPVGTVWMAIAGPEGVYSQKFTFGRLRSTNIERSTYTAINLLCKQLTAGN